MKLKKILKLLIYSITMTATIFYIVYRIGFTIPTKLGITTFLLQYLY